MKSTLFLKKKKKKKKKKMSVVFHCFIERLQIAVKQFKMMHELQIIIKVLSGIQYLTFINKKKHQK